MQNVESVPSPLQIKICSFTQKGAGEIAVRCSLILTILLHLSPSNHCCLKLIIQDVNIIAQGFYIAKFGINCPPLTSLFTLIIDCFDIYCLLGLRLLVVDYLVLMSSSLLRICRERKMLLAVKSDACNITMAEGTSENWP